MQGIITERPVPMEHEKAKRKFFLEGIKAISPLLIPVIPFALITGVSAVGVGIEPFPAIVMSVAVFAGAAQLVAYQLMTTGTPVVVILLATVFVNLRMALYSLALSRLFPGRRLPVRAWMGYLITDHAFVVTARRFLENKPGPVGHWYYFGAAIPMLVVWTLFSVIGIYTAAAIPASWSLGFAIPVMFLAILISGLKSRGMVFAALAGGGVALLTANLPFNLGLMAGTLAGMLAGTLPSPRREAKHE